MYLNYIIQNAFPYKNVELLKLYKCLT